MVTITVKFKQTKSRSVILWNVEIFITRTWVQWSVQNRVVCGRCWLSRMMWEISTVLQWSVQRSHPEWTKQSCLHTLKSVQKIPACEKFSGTSGADQNIGQKAAEGVYLPCGRNIYGRSQWSDPHQPGTSYITEMGGKCQRYNFTERKKSDKMEQRVYEIKGELSNVRTFKICKY